MAFSANQVPLGSCHATSAFSQKNCPNSLELMKSIHPGTKYARAYSAFKALRISISLDFLTLLVLHLLAHSVNHHWTIFYAFIS